MTFGRGASFPYLVLQSDGVFLSVGEVDVEEGKSRMFCDDNSSLQIKFLNAKTILGFERFLPAEGSTPL